MPPIAQRRPSPSGAYRATERTIHRPHPAPWPPTFRVPRSLHRDLGSIERADQDLRRFEADEGTAHRILRDALSRNAYGTASIEGNPLTLAEVDSLLAASPTPGRVTIPDEREILNYAAFVRDLEATPLPGSWEDVCALHAALFEGVLPAPGRLKERPNIVVDRGRGEVVYVPTAPRQVRKELDAALRWHDEADEHAVVRTAMFFHEFQSIHPFADGNGRLGRALATLQLWHAGYRGVRYALVDFAFNEDRTSYYAALDDARRCAWDRTPWLEFMVGLLREGFEGAVQRFLLGQSFPSGLNERQQRVAEWLARLDRSSPGRRVKFNDVHEAFPQVPRRTLQMDLARLVEAEVVQREGERKATTYRWGRAKRPEQRRSAKP